MTVRESPARSIAGRYSLIEVLGKGGVGQVWRARDELLRRDVAVKEVVFPGAISELDRASMQARVLREARAAAGLPHSSVVTVYDVIRDEARGYIVMELISACSISELVQRDGPMPVDKVAMIARQMVEVLEVAHDHGIIHRDVKPGNVMVLDNGAVKLADFGIAWIKDDPKITASGLILGSPSFMAPEQAQGAEITPATDMWGLGATMYYAVEGELPFDKGQTIATLTSVMVDPPRTPRRAGALAPVIQALLAKNPEARPSASQVKSLLTPLAPATPKVAYAPDATAPPQPEAKAEARENLLFEDQKVAPGVGAAMAAGSDQIGEGEAALAGGEPYTVHGEIGGRSRSSWSSTAARLGGILLIAALAAGTILYLANLQNGEDRGRRNAAVASKKSNSHGNKPRDAGRPSPGPTVVGAEPSAPAATSTPSAGPTSTGSTSVSATGATAGWIPYINTATGWSIAYPPGWQPQARDSHDLDFTDPTGGRYLRVAWTTTPGPNPAARWREYSKSFGAGHEDYRTLRISPNFTFKGWKASTWEYTYSSGGALLHAVDLALVNGTYGFALNFQTHDSDWTSSQQLFDAFKQSFQPPA
jgi:eukaryotic-like serine/threonine-protein kinase